MTISHPFIKTIECTPSKLSNCRAVIFVPRPEYMIIIVRFNYWIVSQRGRRPIIYILINNIIAATSFAIIHFLSYMPLCPTIMRPVSTSMYSSVFAFCQCIIHQVINKSTSIITINKKCHLGAFNVSNPCC